MKYLTPAFFASWALLVLSTAKAGPIPAMSELSQREPSDNIYDARQLYDEDSFAFARDLDFDLALERRNFERDFDESMGLEARGCGFPPCGKKKKDPERKAKYHTGNPKPETPVGEFRPLTAGKKDDYFGNWQKMTKGVDNPAAGKGKKKA
ncbi:hypothetical protein M413DRAFT_448075 [Hebeloma cylindrosporum]|uniref:Uncharacterized protein n=1 Tax=Hebeloma cylindrosporum TaxID=76867 RepID=A0A0C3C350_HEBCY|nr:hypothetical protein M413DRAFT_448075 [Hebeloma cylindrosporum h7]